MGDMFRALWNESARRIDG